MAGIYNGKIGKPEREVTITPAEEPNPREVPVEAPAQPIRQPVKVPA